MNPEAIWQIGTSLSKLPLYSLAGNAWQPVFDYFIDEDPDPARRPAVPRFLTVADSVRKVGPGTDLLRVHFETDQDYASATFFLPNAGFIETRLGLKAELFLGDRDLGPPAQDGWVLGTLPRGSWVLQLGLKPVNPNSSQRPITLAYAKLEGIAEPARTDVVITHVCYDGEVARVESDEYVEITNQGNADADLGGWRLHADDHGQDFLFPAGTVLAPNSPIRVYTNQVHTETGGFSYGSGRAIWNNRGDDAKLFDREGELVCHFAYGAAADREGHETAAI